MNLWFSGPMVPRVIRLIYEDSVIWSYMMANMSDDAA